MDIIKAIEQENLNPNAPVFSVGDTVKVFFKVIEGNKERIQAYEGIVIARKHGGLRETFTVHSPKIDKVEVLRRGRVRRAKLYYLRKRTGKAAKIKETV